MLLFYYSLHRLDQPTSIIFFSAIYVLLEIVKKCLLIHFCQLNCWKKFESINLDYLHIPLMKKKIN